MRQLLVLNDVHLGVNRQSGTTPASAAALRYSLKTAFRHLVSQHFDKDLLIAGDLFDQFAVDSQTVLDTYMVLSYWLDNSDGGVLTLVMGNHDFQPKADKLSSFHFLCHLLSERWGNRVREVSEPANITDGLFAIPHRPNQDIFNMDLEAATELKDHIIILHANWSNNFAVHSDHSLNVSKDQAEALIAGGNRLFFAHEHQHRRAMNGNVIIAGNQWPSSISDCLTHGAGQLDGAKYAHILKPAGSTWDIEPIETWHAAEDYKQVDWQDIPDLKADGFRFIRVTGEASAAQASEVVNLVSALRRNCDAFVVGNSVKIEGIEGVEDLADASFDEVKSFNVMAALLEQLDDREREVVQGLMEDVQ